MALSQEVKPLRSRDVSPAAQIEEALGVEEIAKKLLCYPEQIRRQQEKVQAAKEAVERAKEELQLVESMLFSQINTEKDPRSGKAMYSNQQAREAELARRKAADPEYQAAGRALHEAEAALAAAQFDQDRLYNEFSAYKIVANMTSNRLGLMAAMW